MDNKHIFEWDNGIVVDTGNYEEYMRSSAWKWVRQKALKEAGNKCVRCSYAKGLEIHHKHYDSLGREEAEDLEVLCKRCHKRADREREQVNAYSNAYDTYVRKKYGESVARSYSGDFTEEFNEWLERKNDEHY